MRNTIVTRFLLNVLAILISSWLLPGIEVKGFTGAVFVAFFLGLLNMFIKPIVIFFTLPVTVVTFGLFLLVIDAIIIMLANEFLDSIWVKNWLWAILFGIVLSIINSILYSTAIVNKRG